MISEKLWRFCVYSIKSSHVRKEFNCWQLLKLNTYFICFYLVFNILFAFHLAFKKVDFQACSKSELLNCSLTIECQNKLIFNVIRLKQPAAK